MSKAYPFQGQLRERQRKVFSERLLRLADLMDVTPREKYNHEHFGVMENGEIKSCCAAGWTFVNAKKLFPGLRDAARWVCPDSSAPDSGYLLFHDLYGELSAAAPDRVLGNYFGKDALSHIFGFTAFSENAEITPKMVAKRIRKFVRESYGYEPA